MASQTANIQSLIDDAQSSGLLSQVGADALSVQDIGEQIAAALGNPALETQASEVVLVGLLIDDSGSIRMVAGNSEAVREGHNSVLEALGGTKQKDGVQIHCRYLNGTVLYPFGPIDAAQEMTQRNYNPTGGTPLYDQTVVLLATMAAKIADFENAGIPVRTITVIVTDGADMHSQSSTPADIKKIVTPMLKKESHIFCGMGIDDGQKDHHGNPIPGTGTDFRKVFAEMGVPDNWILTPGNSPHEIRQAFALVSKSAVRASQSAASFSKAASGGFAT